MTSDADQDSMVDIPTAPTENLIPIKKTVKPWHAPRKQWIRLYQWNAHIENLIDEISSATGNPFSELSYLSLPGTELLDVRTVLQVCSYKKVRLKFLGFNYPENETQQDRITLNISESELKKQPNVHPSSLVVKDKLEMLAEKKSIAQNELNQFGGLDVINLDLTNCVANQIPSGIQQDYYKAIHQLFEHQKKKRVSPFLFFLTTRVNPEQINRAAFGALLNVLSANFNLHPSFAEKMKDCLGIDASDIKAAQADSGFTSISRFLDKIFSMSLGKWMLSLLLGGGSQWSLEMKESCSYTVNPAGSPDMFSFAFICRPTERPSVDHFGLSGLLNSAQISTPVDIELIFAKKLVDAVAKVFDLDRRMHCDEQLTNELVNKAAELMRQANYDPEEYKTEARKQLSKVAGWIQAKDNAVCA